MNGELALAYVGEYSKHNPNVPHGYGAMLYHDHGGLYEGRFVNGKRHGRGKLVIGDDEDEKASSVGCATFAGQWKDDAFDGLENRFTNGQGVTLRGAWKRGNLQFGVEISEEENIVLYHGTYEGNKREGNMCYEGMRDGGMAVGGFKEGKMHGCCAYAYPCSTIKLASKAKETALEYWDASKPALRGIFYKGRLLKDTAEYFEKGMSREDVKRFVENTPVKKQMREGTFEDNKRDPREQERVEMVKGKLVAKRNARWSSDVNSAVDFVALVSATHVRYARNCKVRWSLSQRISVLDDLTSSDEEEDEEKGNDRKKQKKENNGESGNENVARGGYFFEYDEPLKHSLGCEATIVRDKKHANVKRRTYFSPYLGRCIALVPTKDIKKGEEICVQPDYSAGYRLGPKRYRSLVKPEEE